MKSSLNIHSQIIKLQFTSSDRLPNKICSDCQSRLDDSFQFKTQVSANQWTLTRLLQESTMPLAKVEMNESANHVDFVQLEDEYKVPLQTINFYPDNRCPVCAKIFKNQRDITLHIERIHEGRKDYECDLCAYRSYKKFDMALHHRNVHTTGGPSDQKVLCQKCGRTMRIKSDLNRHIQKHHLQVKRFVCDVCDFESFERASMLVHQKTHLPIEQREAFQCNLCGKILSTRNTLKAHIGTVHEENRLFACTICPKSFAMKNCLQKHIKKVHLKSKEFKCNICQVFVSQASYLKRHKEMMHPPDGIKIKYPCDVCNQMFSTPHSLRNHIQVHREPEFECICCLKKFHKKGNLLDHMEHHETLSYPCQHCTRSFRNEAKLKHHLKRVHFKEKETFRCELCLTITFTRRTTYRDHILKLHKELDASFRQDWLERISKMQPEERIQ